MNLTVVIDEDTLKRARIRAIQENTSVNAVVREFLASTAGRGVRALAGVVPILQLQARRRQVDKGRVA